VVFYLAQLNTVQTDTCPTGSAISFIGNYCLSFLFGEDFRWTAINKIICVFFMIEGTVYLNVWHETIETGRNW